MIFISKKSFPCDARSPLSFRKCTSHVSTRVPRTSLTHQARPGPVHSTCEGLADLVLAAFRAARTTLIAWLELGCFSWHYRYLAVINNRTLLQHGSIYSTREPGSEGLSDHHLHERVLLLVLVLVLRVGLPAIQTYRPFQGKYLALGQSHFPFIVLTENRTNR